MIMKKIYLLISSVLCLGLTSCFDLDQEPQGELSTVGAFKTTSEITMYLNMFYQGSVPVSGGGSVNNTAIKTQSSSPSNGIAYGDANSDNLLPNAMDTRLSGRLALSSASELTDYKAIRNVNFLLKNIENCETRNSDYEQCLGEAYYFRAAYYYHLLVNYGGVTWVEDLLEPDAGQMQLPRNTRSEIADRILADLDLAITNLKEENDNTSGRVHRDVARALKSEVALFAATWEKYHRAAGDDFYDKSLTDADGKIQNWLEQARDAAKAVMDRGIWEISRINGNPETDYRDLFITQNLNGNQEVLWWKRYDPSAGIGNNVTYYGSQGGGQHGVSASLVDDYLTRDGKPFVGTEKENAKKEYGKELDPDLRDPRLSQTVFMPGQVMLNADGSSTTTFSFPPIDVTTYNQNTTGYSMLKYIDIAPTSISENQGHTAAIQVRYADILLNYAEALAELKTGDYETEIKNALQPLRERVGMPGVNFDLEFNQEADYPFNGLDKYIQAVRRERRVEKALENCRLTDILRWAAADELIIGKFPLGALYTGTTLEDKFADKLTDGDGFWLKDGYILSCNVADYPSGWQFNPNRDYLLPIRQDMVGSLTGGLWVQNPGW